MADFILFASEQWLMFGVLIALAVMLIMHEGRKGGAAVTPAQMTTMVNNEDGVVLDIRDAADFKVGHIVGAVNVPNAKLQGQLTMLEKHKTDPIIVVCKFGQTAGSASKVLKEAGFEKVFKLGGGMSEWQASQMPVVSA